ncbi:MAG: response regulator transcription factor [Bacteroidetes bacterium]|nr:response regulator transcription factor [Bacteroidota bacterium]
MIKAIIIDDEKHCSDNLQWQLRQYCPEIKVAGVCKSPDQGLNEISKQQPQLVFLDVEMPGMSGFEMLEQLTDINFDIIFTTAFNQYAIRAIKFGALDYLVKPIDKDELRAAVDKVLKHTNNESLKQLTALLTHIRKSNDLSFQKIALPTIHGYELVPLNNVMYCESKSNYTNIHLNNGQQILISRTLKDIEELLNTHPFFRLHNSFLVNLQYAIRYIRGEGGFLVLNNDITIPVSRNKKEELLKLIAHLSA